VKVLLLLHSLVTSHNLREWKAMEFLSRHVTWSETLENLCNLQCHIDQSETLKVNSVFVILRHMFWDIANQLNLCHIVWNPQLLLYRVTWSEILKCNEICHIICDIKQQCSLCYASSHYLRQWKTTGVWFMLRYLIWNIEESWNFCNVISSNTRLKRKAYSFKSHHII
jgi:hypothetical protein